MAGWPNPLAGYLGLAADVERLEVARLRARPPSGRARAKPRARRGGVRHRRARRPIRTGAGGRASWNRREPRG
jgi:hypothetical protein